MRHLGRVATRGANGVYKGRIDDGRIPTIDNRPRGLIIPARAISTKASTPNTAFRRCGSGGESQFVTAPNDEGGQAPHVAVGFIRNSQGPNDQPTLTRAHLTSSGDQTCGFGLLLNLPPVRILTSAIFRSSHSTVDSKPPAPFVGSREPAP